MFSRIRAVVTPSVVNTEGQQRTDKQKVVVCLLVGSPRKDARLDRCIVCNSLVFVGRLVRRVDI